MIPTEYAGILGRAKFFWRFRCVKLRAFIEGVGLLSIYAFGIIMMYATIRQWYEPNHILRLDWNRYGEAYFEYLWSVIALPCSLYYLVNALRRNWRRLGMEFS